MKSNITIIDWSNTCEYKKVNGLYVLLDDIYITFSCGPFVFEITVKKGAMTDGLSVPRLFRFFLPCWDDKNVLYNISGIVHDACYGSEILSKSFADALFHRSLVTAGISKRKANIAGWCVENLAGLRYGRDKDDFDIAPFVRLKMCKITYHS